MAIKRTEVCQRRRGRKKSAAYVPGRGFSPRYLNISEGTRRHFTALPSKCQFWRSIGSARDTRKGRMASHPRAPAASSSFSLSLSLSLSLNPRLQPPLDKTKTNQPPAPQLTGPRPAPPRASRSSSELLR
jgi:hypothetical protein